MDLPYGFSDQGYEKRKGSDIGGTHQGGISGGAVDWPAADTVSSVRKFWIAQR